MKRVALISYKEDVNVYDGVSQLTKKYPKHLFLVPITKYGMFAKSALTAITEGNVQYHLFFSEEASTEEVINAEDITFCANPNREVMKHLVVDDVLGIAWDDSPEAAVTLHALEDYGLETWNITDGLDVIEVDFSGDSTDELYDHVLETVSHFVDALSAYVMSAVTDMLAQAVAERIAEDEDRKDINPFKDN